MKELFADWKLVLGMGGALVAAVAMIAYAFFRPAVNPEDEERKRRQRIAWRKRLPAANQRRRRRDEHPDV